MARLASKPPERHDRRTEVLELARSCSRLVDDGETEAPLAVLLIHGFGANTEHWRFNQPVLAKAAATLRSTYRFGRRINQSTPEGRSERLRLGPLRL